MAGLVHRAKAAAAPASLLSGDCTTHSLRNELVIILLAAPKKYTMLVFVRWLGLMLAAKVESDGRME
jgi:hypothetical protein